MENVKIIHITQEKKYFGDKKSIVICYILRQSVTITGRILTKHFCLLAIYSNNIISRIKQTSLSINRPV